ncbi:MAG: hypothetical protein U0T77_08505 [Chitinophagales bacterium]
MKNKGYGIIDVGDDAAKNYKVLFMKWKKPKLAEIISRLGNKRCVLVPNPALGRCYPTIKMHTMQDLEEIVSRNNDQERIKLTTKNLENNVRTFKKINRITIEKLEWSF